MSRLVGTAYHPVNGSKEEIYEGFSWPCLFFGSFWFLQKGMVAWALISFVLACVTFGVSWLFFPFFANGLHAKLLLDRGYLNEDQWKRLQQQRSAAPIAPVVAMAPSSMADELGKLARLKEQGILSEEEFNRQKSKLLG